MRKIVKPVLVVWLFIVLVACVAETEPVQEPEATNVVTPGEPSAQSLEGQVILRESAISWETYAYELNDRLGIIRGSYDGENKTTQTFSTWILENEYLQVTLLPDYGGRILSIIYKPTGHEELYQNPVGVPYQIGTGIFYYDWLMVYGGIFPTFPEPEHGKTWLLPWEFQIVQETEQEVTVAMSFTDDIDNPRAPGQYNLGPTGLEVIYYVTLKAGRTAVDTKVEITNPGETSVDFEYWTNATLAPGSNPADPKTTAGAEIIAPVEQIKIPSYWESISAQENATGLMEVYDFMNLKHFQNWSDMGIAYAFPDMGGKNFWGVINHDNEEGIFRIADNTVTPGLKLWTWGYPQSTAIDPHTTAKEARPYIELWAGVTQEFWQRASFPGQDTMVIEETYSPSVGLTNVTHANDHFLVNLEPDGSSAVTCQVFGLEPDQIVEISMFLDGQEIATFSQDLDPLTGNDCSTAIPEWSPTSVLSLLIKNANDELLFEGDLDFSTLE